MIEAVEFVVRCHLNETNVMNLSQSGNIHGKIVEEISTKEIVISCWEAITASSGTNESCSELLLAIVDLWVTVRAHAFAKEWTMKFHRKFTKGTRKSLLPRLC